MVKDVYSSGAWKETIYYVDGNYVYKVNTTDEISEKYIKQNGMTVAQEIDGVKQSLHPDHLGSTSLILDSDGAVVEDSWVSPFGESIEGGKDTRYDYTGKELDEVTGNYDFNKRMYVSEWGIFTQTDPKIQDKYNSKDLNHYSYVRNNPYKFIDPEGKDAWLVVAPNQAGGNGHVAVIIGNSEMGYRAYSQGAVGGRDAVGSSVSALSRNVEGGVYISPEAQANPTLALQELQDPSLPDMAYVDAIHFETTIDQDKDMDKTARALKDKYERKERKYQVLIDNCADFTADVMNAANINTNAVSLSNKIKNRLKYLYVMVIFTWHFNQKRLQKKEKKMFEKEKVGMDLDLPNVCRYSLNP